MRISVTVLLLVIVGCSAKETTLDEGKSKSKVKMSDGSIVNNCVDYNSSRLQLSLLESNRNKSIAAEYLPCAELFITGEIVDKQKVLKAIYSRVKIAKFPLSVSNSMDNETTFQSANWHIDPAENKISYEKDDTNIVIFLQGKLKDRYLPAHPFAQ